MSILIVGLIKRVFYDEETGCCWIRAKAGNDVITVEFKEYLYDLPKILKTVEYKVTGKWRPTRRGKNIFSVDSYEKAGKIKLVKYK